MPGPDPSAAPIEPEAHKKTWTEPVLTFWGNFSALVQAIGKSGGRSDGRGFKRGVG